MGELLFVGLLAAGGAMLILNGVTFRLASRNWRRWIATYERGGHTRFQRRGPLVNVPLGLGLISSALALSVGAQPWRGLFGAMAVLWCVCALALWFHAPAWAQPVWMRPRRPTGPSDSRGR